MQPISFKRHGFPPEAVRYPVSQNFHLRISVRDIEELLAERGIDPDKRVGQLESAKFRISVAGAWTSPR